jgi:hypothetical protein
MELNSQYYEGEDSEACNNDPATIQQKRRTCNVQVKVQEVDFEASMSCDDDVLNADGITSGARDSTDAYAGNCHKNRGLHE